MKKRSDIGSAKYLCWLVWMDSQEYPTRVTLDNMMLATGRRISRGSCEAYLSQFRRGILPREARECNLNR